jgi:hypothetical protein
MTTVESVGIEVEEAIDPERGWNWGLLLVLGFCAGFWSLVVLGIVALL